MTAGTAGLFTGIRVLELGGGRSAAWCGRILADYGADVVRVVDPTVGAPQAESSPELEAVRLGEDMVLHANKRSITLRIEEQTLDVLRRLLERFDVVVEGERPAFWDGLGWDWAEVRQALPRLVVTSITWFGQSGPYRDYAGSDIVAYALSGVMSYGGIASREPLMHGGQQATVQGGIQGAAATAIALFNRERAGVGEHADVSIHEAMTATMVHGQPIYAFAGGICGRPKQSEGINQMLPCQDGFAIIQAQDDAEWEKLAVVVGRPELADAPATPAEARERHEVLVDALSTMRMAELFEKGQNNGLVVGIVQTPGGLLACEHLAARDFYADVTHPTAETGKIPLGPIKMSETPATIRRRASTPGQDNEGIYQHLVGMEADELKQLASRRLV